MAKQNQHDLTLRQRRIYDFLNGQHVGVLATVDPNGEPHAAVLYFAVDKRFVLHFITRTGTRKYDNLIHNNHVMIVVFDASAQIVAQITGKAVEIEDSTEVNDVALRVFRSTIETEHNGTPPLTKLDAGSYTAFKIKPDQIRLATYAQPDSGHHQEIFESIESFDLFGADGTGF